MSLTSLVPPNAVHYGMLRHRACASTLNPVAPHRPGEAFLKTRTVHPLVLLTNWSATPVDPSAQTALSATPHPTTAVPAVQFDVTVVTHVPFAAGVQAPRTALTVPTAFPGPAGP
jgi:hypothetical protein